MDVILSKFDEFASSFRTAEKDLTTMQRKSATLETQNLRLVRFKSEFFTYTRDGIQIFIICEKCKECRGKQIVNRKRAFGNNYRRAKLDN